MSTSDLRVGKGIMEVSNDSGANWRDVGNATVFNMSLGVERLDHFSARSGVRAKDRSVVIEKSATLSITLEEFTEENLRLALMADQDSTGENRIGINTEIRLMVRFTDTNDVGAKYVWTFPQVDFVPEGELQLISEEWGSFQLSGEVAVQTDGEFGTFVISASA
ncbi:MAG: hypothetical protein K2Y29_00420 [Beijerinckiaceae bacterium]|nr:hypothetical protein [Beijerinckiaceae bacterium]